MSKATLYEKAESPTESPEVDYTNIGYLETPAQEAWFVERQDDEGRPLVYLRIQVTGMLPRLVGPFPSRNVALFCLDRLVERVWEDLEWELCDQADQHGVRRPFHHRILPILTEDPLLCSLNE